MYNLENKKKNNYLNIFDDFNNFFENALSKEMKTNIVDNGNSYHLACEMPGIKKENIKINFENDTLSITVSKNNNNKEENKNYIIKERYESSLKRSFYLEDVDANSINAKLEDGILNITLNKVEEKKNPKKIIEIE